MNRRLFYAILIACTAFLQSVVGEGSAVLAQTSSVLTGVKDLEGSDPNSWKNWIMNEEDYTNNTPEKTFFLYNVGTGQFLYIGGSYGTHAAMADTPQYFYIYNNTDDGTISSSKSATKLNLRTKQITKNTTSTKPNQSNDFMQYVAKDQFSAYGPYFDRYYNNSNGGGSYGWVFTPVSVGSKTYYIHQTKSSDNTELYLTAQDDPTNGNTCEALAYQGTDKQQWKFISLTQYYELFKQSPASLSAPTDASFLILDHDFSVNNKNAVKWKKTNGTTIKLGTYDMYKEDPSASSYSGPKAKNGPYQLNYGRFFCAAITSNTGELYQDITVDKAGWYIFRCKGFSNQKAELFVETLQVRGTGTTEQTEKIVTTPLNFFESTATDPMLQAGINFSNGLYENQVMIYITDDEKDSNGKYHLRFGIRIKASSSAKLLTRATSSSTGQTIFDTFRMLYAKSNGTPNLILDEDNFDLNYLTKTSDEYKNAVLYLRRTFTIGKWNTFILPVDLTYGQMKRTFGDEVRLARLNYLGDSSIHFVTVEPSSDNDVMLQAYVPYIIKPTKGPGENQQDTEELHTGSSSTTNVWKGKYRGTPVTDGQITIPAKHYEISMVTLDRSLLYGEKAKMDANWVSKLTDDTGSKGNTTMTAYGTLAKTYNESKIIKGRDNLSGGYFMKNGSFYQVPTGKSYGLKAFRCWFKAATNSSAKSVQLYLDDVMLDAVETTGISSVLADNGNSAKAGVYNISGQLMGNTLQGLPAGLYIVNGKKVVVH